MTPYELVAVAWAVLLAAWAVLVTGVVTVACWLIIRGWREDRRHPFGPPLSTRTVARFARDKEGHPRSGTRLELLELSRKLQDTRSAIAQLKRALAEHPDSPALKVNLESVFKRFDELHADLQDYYVQRERQPESMRREGGMQ